MRKTIEILGVPFDVVTMDEAVERALGFLGEEGRHFICTPNPEIVMEAQKDKELMDILHQADLVIPDGIGVVWASRYAEEALPERVAGYDLTQRLFAALQDTQETFYFFGAAPGVSAKAAKRMQEVYPNLRIVGGHNGYFDEKEERRIIADIKKKQPSVLLVGLGAPKQEKWIYENIRLLNVKLCIGIGGCFDVMAGNVKRAPKAFRKLGLEWFYRLISQPSRWKRMLRLPLFVLEVRKRRRKS